MPTHINYFFNGYDNESKSDVKKKVVYIACGAYHSLAITDDSKLYSWGEAKLGQCGTGKKKTEPLPTEVLLN